MQWSSSQSAPSRPPEPGWQPGSCQVARPRCRPSTANHAPVVCACPANRVGAVRACLAASDDGGGSSLACQRGNSASLSIPLLLAPWLLHGSAGGQPTRAEGLASSGHRPAPNARPWPNEARPSTGRRPPIPREDALRAGPALAPAAAAAMLLLPSPSPFSPGSKPERPTGHGHGRCADAAAAAAAAACEREQQPLHR